MSNFLFQILEWNSYHGSDGEYKLRIFGKTLDKKSVCLIVSGFKPYFLIKVPEEWTKDKIIMFEKGLRRLLPKHVQQSLVSCKLKKKKQLYGFTAGKLFKYVQITFNNMFGYYKASKLFNEPILILEVHNKAKFYEKQETNIDSIMRCMYERELSASGWIRVENSAEIDEPISTCDIELYTSIDNIHPYKQDIIVPFKIISFDLECYSSDGISFPQAYNPEDKIIQIGNTFSEYGKSDCYKKVIFTLDSCAKFKSHDGIPVQIFAFEDESDMLVEWAKFIREEDPDFLVGYNIFGFDEKYLKDRAELLNCLDEVSKLGRIIDEECEFKKKEMSSAAYGVNELWTFMITGRVQIDLMKVIQRNYQLDGYKLDNVVAQFIREKVTAIEKKEGGVKIITKSTNGLMNDSYIALTLDNKISKSEIGKKFLVTTVCDKYFEIKGDDQVHALISDVLSNSVGDLYWSEAKDDIAPRDIFAKQKGTAQDRAIIAKYCLKDCELVNKLISKLDIISNNMGMASVCHVPLSFIFMRGQSIKSFSLIAKKCYLENYAVPVLPSPKDSDDTYEGATVFEPDAGVYLVPIVVDDFNSLYPSCAIEINGSHETLVIDNQYNNLEGYTYRNVTYNNGDGSQTTCRYARPIPKDKNNILQGTMGIIPTVLTELLDSRKKTRAILAQEKDPFKQKILDGLQLAYKITANSVYGFLGAETSQLRLRELAASITATGRERLTTAKKDVESEGFKEYVLKNFFIGLEKDFDDEKTMIDKVEKAEFPCSFKAEVIYGDTDSIFINFNIRDKNNELRTDDMALIIAIRLGILSGKYINLLVPPPQKIAYEKTIKPFIIPSKKKYIGLLYEKNPNKSSLKCMGMVLKRRDNAPIVKEIFGGMINTLIKDRNINLMLKQLKQSLEAVAKGEYPMSKFIISKKLGTYKNPNSIAHKVLADRIGLRDPGNKPQLNDRIPYVYFVNKKAIGRKILQGELIETPTYVKEKKLKLNYYFYITNQIMKPVLQILELLMYNPQTFFDRILEKAYNIALGTVDITSYFGIKTKEHDMDAVDLSQAIYKFKDSGNLIHTDITGEFPEEMFIDDDLHTPEDNEMPDVPTYTGKLKESKKKTSHKKNKAVKKKLGKLEYCTSDEDDDEEIIKLSK